MQCDLILIIFHLVKVHSADKFYQWEWERYVRRLKYINLFWMKDICLVKKVEANVTRKAGEVRLRETLKDR